MYNFFKDLYPQSGLWSSVIPVMRNQTGIYFNKSKGVLSASNPNLACLLLIFFMYGQLEEDEKYWRQNFEQL